MFPTRTNRSQQLRELIRSGGLPASANAEMSTRELTSSGACSTARAGWRWTPIGEKRIVHPDVDYFYDVGE